MPATKLTFYPGSSYDLTYGGAGFGWTDLPLPAEIDDGSDVPSDPTYGLFTPSTSTPRTAYAEYKAALGPTGIVSIASVRLIAWCMFTGTGGTYDTDVSAMVRPSGTGTGATGAYFSAALTRTSHSAALEVFEALEFAAWTTNPETASAWTLSDLLAMAFGVRFAAPATGIANASIKLGRLRMEIEATVLAANIEAVRTLLSTGLRFFCRPPRQGRIVGPALLADVGLAETFFMNHRRGPRPAGPGWGFKTWQRQPLFATQKSVDGITGQATISFDDSRRRLTRLWIPGLTTLGHSLDGQGLPLLHSGGGGPACTRAGAAKYIDRPANPTDNVLQAATDDILAHDYRGMCVEAGDETNLIVNSTFSQGTGNTFTNWTATVTGTGTVTQETARVGVDEPGLRRAARVDVGSTDASWAIVEQAVAVTGAFRPMIRTYNAFGSGKLGCVIQRASDSFYYNFVTPGWDAVFAAANHIARIGNTAEGYREWLPGEVDPGGADTVTLKTGYHGEAGTVLGGVGYFAYVWSVDLIEGRDHVGTPIVTTTTALAKISDIVRIPNNEVGRWWGHERGFSWSLGFIPLWTAADLSAGEVRMLLWVDYGNGNNAQIAYQKGVDAIEDRWVFSIVSDSVGYTSEYVVAALPLLQPLRGRLVKLSGYWVGPEAERGLPVGQILVAVNDDWTGGVPAVVPADEPMMDPVSTGYLGHAWESEAPLAWCSGFLRQVDVSPFLLEEEELERKPS